VPVGLYCIRYVHREKIDMDRNNDDSALPCMVDARIALDDDGGGAAQHFADTRAGALRIPERRQNHKGEMTSPINTSAVAHSRQSNGTVRKVLIVITTAIVLSPLPSAATPCTPRIDRGWTQVYLKIQARIGAGRSAPQGSMALLHHQPTPSSVAAARDVSNDAWLPIEAAVSGSSRARQADKDNDEDACDQALIEVQRAIQP
jgi:hypothetical protein